MFLQNKEFGGAESTASNAGEAGEPVSLPSLYFWIFYQLYTFPIYFTYF